MLSLFIMAPAMDRVTCADESVACVSVHGAPSVSSGDQDAADAHSCDYCYNITHLMPSGPAPAVAMARMVETQPGPPGMAEPAWVSFGQERPPRA